MAFRCQNMQELIIIINSFFDLYFIILFYWVDLLIDISNAQYRLPNSPTCVPLLGHTKPIHYNSTSPKPDLILSFHLLQCFHTQSLMPFPHARHILHLYHFPWFYRTNNTAWEAHTMQLQIIRFYSASRHVLQLTPKYLPVQPIFKALSLYSSLNVKGQVTQQYKTQKKITILYILIYSKREDQRLNGTRRSPKLCSSQFLYACNYDLPVPQPTVRSLPHLQRIYCPHLCCNFDLHSVQETWVYT
jgi:hypothetical protein